MWATGEARSMWPMRVAAHFLNCDFDRRMFSQTMPLVLHPLVLAAEALVIPSQVRRCGRRTGRRARA